MGALTRVDRLAGALAVDACLKEGEHASSPVRKAQVGSGPDPFGCPEPFLLVDSAKLNQLRRKIRRRRWMLGGWSGKNLALVRRWEKFWNC